MKVHAVPVDLCPCCGVVVTGSLGPRPPRRGDLSMCAYCGGVCRYGADFRRVAVLDEELATFTPAEQAQIAAMQRHVRANPRPSPAWVEQ